MERRLLPSIFGVSPLSRTGMDPFVSLRREMDRLFDDAFRGMAPQAEGGATMSPSLDIAEAEGEIRICAELPGIGQDDVEIDLTDDLLTISGHKRIERDDRRENYHVVERSHGRFSRSIRLPFRVDPDQVRADFENGVLTLTIPKPADQQRSRRIPVNARAGGTGPDEAGRSIGRAAEEMRSANAPGDMSGQAMEAESPAQAGSAEAGAGSGASGRQP